MSIRVVIAGKKYLDDEILFGPLRVSSRIVLSYFKSRTPGCYFPVLKPLVPVQDANQSYDHTNSLGDGQKNCRRLKRKSPGMGH
jgi:hypothetical protein